MQKNAKRVDIIIFAVIALMIVGGILAAVIPKNEQPATAVGDKNGDGRVTVEDYIGTRIGIITGTSFEAPSLENFPGSDFLYFNSYSDIGTALVQNKIDGFLGDEPALRIMNNEQPGIGYLNDLITRDEYAFGFPKNNARTDDIRDKFDQMLTEFSSDGTLEEMQKKWFGNDESQKIVDLTGFTGENGTLKVVTTSTDVPFSYIKDNKNVGYSIELVEKFCRKYGYTPSIEDVDFSARVPGLASEKYDMCASSLAVTEERKESIDFSGAIYDGGIALAVRSSDIAATDTSAPAHRNVTAPTYKDFNGKPVGILTGSAFEPTTLEKFPDSEYLYFNTYSDLNTALLEKRIDGYLADGPTAEAIHAENRDISHLADPVGVDSYSFLFSKTEERSQTLLKQFNAMLAEMTSDGTLAKIQDIWFGDDTSVQVIDRSGLTGENGMITVGTYSEAVPFTMFTNGELSGMTTDLMYRFAERYGYELSFEDTDINGMLTGLAAGKYDMLAAPFSKTPEREEAADFSEPFYSADICLAVRTENAGLSYKDYIGKRVGILTGSSFEEPTFEFLPDSEYFYFDSFSDLIMALAKNKIDCFIEDEPLLRVAAIDHPELSYLPEILKEDKYSFCFQKNGEKAELLQKQFNEMIAELEADGTMESLRAKWYDGDAASAEIDRSGITGENGTLNVFVNPLNVPTAMIVDGELKGYAVELMTMFCRKYGYDCKYEQANISSGLAGIASGIYDVGANNVTVTPEREESVRFSDPVYYGGISLAVRKSDLESTAADTAADSEPGFFDSIASSFEKNFIRESRWKLIAEGIGTTCIITVLSALFGSMLAFLVCMFRRTGSRLAVIISNIYVKLLQGTPIVVLLMILYYVVLGRSGLEAVWVAVIGFTLNFGAYASEIMRSGIESIDDGQREAALALGYSENQAFFKFIFPQAAVRFLPVYRGEIVSLLKSTSIVGYIAIQDLTKMSDIIRSRTYEAFFPLIATAIIYFILAWVISLILKAVLKGVDRRHRKRNAVK